MRETVRGYVCLRMRLCVFEMAGISVRRGRVPGKHSCPPRRSAPALRRAGMSTQDFSHAGQELPRRGGTWPTQTLTLSCVGMQSLGMYWYCLTVSVNGYGQICHTGLWCGVVCGYMWKGFQTHCKWKLNWRALEEYTPGCLFETQRLPCVCV